MLFDWYSFGLATALWFIIALLTLQRKKGRPKLGFSDSSSLNRAHKGFKPFLLQSMPWLRLLALFLIVLAIGRPRIGLEKVKTAKEGVAMEMVVDRSSSMNQGMPYQGHNQSRLQVVKQVFELFVLGDGNSLKGRKADQIGLITFAGFAEELAPLTEDHQTLNHMVQGIGTAQKFEDGTMIGDGLYLATLRLKASESLFAQNGASHPIKGKVIVLLTDGQQSRGGLEPLKVAQMAAQNQIRIYSIAILEEGSSNKGIFSFFSQKLDTTLLEEIARVSGGQFFRATEGEELQKIYEKINEIEKTKFEEHYSRYEEFFPYLVGLAIFLLILEFSTEQVWLRRL